MKVKLVRYDNKEIYLSNQLEEKDIEKIMEFQGVRRCNIEIVDKVEARIGYKSHNQEKYYRLYFDTYKECIEEIKTLPFKDLLVNEIKITL